MFCWELAVQLRRDVKPKLDAAGVKLVLVSIGTFERSQDFAEETQFPRENLYADPENAAYDALGFYKGWGRTFFRTETPFSIKDRLEQNDMAKDMRDVLKRWKPWLPPKSDQGLQQGGMLVFAGKECVYRHYDEATGAHADFDDVVAAAAAAAA